MDTLRHWRMPAGPRNETAAALLAGVLLGAGAEPVWLQVKWLLALCAGL